jgi:hypothetical protein
MGRTDTNRFIGVKGLFAENAATSDLVGDHLGQGLDRRLFLG